jgi:hypothetical protein
MADIQKDGDGSRALTEQDYGAGAVLKTYDADLALVNGAARRSESFITNKQWNLLWRDADLLYQSPRPLTVYENTYILEPNVQRFTVAKVTNAVVPQLYKGLFYTDPPFVLRPRPGTSQKVVDAKSNLSSVFLDECNFKAEVRAGLEQMALFGTGIWKWGVEYKEIQTITREADQIVASTGESSDPNIKSESVTIPKDTPPKIKRTTRTVPRPFFENRRLDKVLIDPKTNIGDIRRAKYVIDVRYVDFYDIDKIRKAIVTLPEDHPDRKKWRFPLDEEGLMSWWMPPNQNSTAQPMAVELASEAKGFVHHAQDQNIVATPDLLATKKELLEYWDARKKIVVISREHVLFSGDNEFGQIPFLSANWWNRSNAFYGMGLGLIVGQNQRVDQGTINAILKILSFGVNPVYLRRRDSNATTQMMRTSIGKIFTVDAPPDGDLSKVFSLLETPKVPNEVWQALSESEKATESSSGADQTLVQGSSAGPRSSITRTAGGAGIMANASATRLDGPLDNLIDQVFLPFLYIMDYLVKCYVSDAEIMRILGDEMGKDYQLDLKDFHSGKVEYEILAGASLAAKRTMAQSMALLTQIFENPGMQENLADINGEYIDFKPILNMWMEASEWKDKNDIIKPMTPVMVQRRQQKSQAAQAQSKAAINAQSNQQKFMQKSALEQQSADNRVKRDLVVASFRDNSLSEATEGVPSTGGLEGQQPTVV